MSIVLNGYQLLITAFFDKGSNEQCL